MSGAGFEGEKLEQVKIKGKRVKLCSVSDEGAFYQGHTLLQLQMRGHLPCLPVSLASF